MKRYFHLSKTSEFITASIFLAIFFSLCIIFMLITYFESLWFVFLIFFFIICFIINYQILKRIVLLGIKYDNGNVLLQGSGCDEINKFHINELKKVELQDFKKNPVESQALYEKVNICFILKSGRIKRLQLMQISDIF